MIEKSGEKNGEPVRLPLTLSVRRNVHAAFLIADLFRRTTAAVPEAVNSKTKTNIPHSERVGTDTGSSI